jgi:hypothetical protein
VVLPPSAVSTAVEAFGAAGIPARVVGEVVDAGSIGEGRYAEGPLESVA